MNQPSSPVLIAELLAALRRHAPRRGEAALDFALQEALARPGRLARGQLSVRTALAVGLDRETAVEFGCALEFWHLASLLLDDLPCMDDAERRRGAPCLHRTHGESTALLAALALINRAYQLAHGALAAQPLPVRRNALTLLDRVLGPDGLLGGQSLDLQHVPALATSRDPGRIAWRKTGVLLWLAMGLPAATGATPGELQRLRHLAVYWGLAYQLIDDLTDLAPAGDPGKDHGQDSRHRRPNAVTAMGRPAARTRLARLLLLAEIQLAGLRHRHPRWAYLYDWQLRIFAAAGEIRRAA
ncbi:MAG: polyprenyl synthetase family protein [Opitutales bacterium]